MDKCPFCGTGISRDSDVWTLFFCGSERNKREGTNWQGTRCKDRQIAQLQERLEAWHQHWKEDHGYETNWTPALRKLKNLEEI